MKELIEFLFNQGNEFTVKMIYELGKKIEIRNKDGKVVYMARTDGWEAWFENDENNNCFHYYDSYGIDYWYDDKGIRISKEEFDKLHNKIEYPIKEYDERGNLIHSKNSNGYEYWYEYDKNNNIIHCKDYKGKEYWYDDKGNVITKGEFDKLHNKMEYPIKEFDERGNCIYYKDSNSYERWCEYDENNNLIYYKDSNGYEYWYEYNENNNFIHHKSSYGFESWYDDEGNIITKEEFDKLHKKETDPIIEYDEKGNFVHFKNSEGLECWYKYDENNNRIRYYDSTGFDYRYEYDKNNNCIHCYDDFYGKEWWKEYDENNKLIHYTDNRGNDCWYNDKGNEITKGEFDKLHNILVLPGWSKELIDNMDRCPLCGAKTDLDDFKWLQIDGCKYICNHCRNTVHK